MSPMDDNQKLFLGSLLAGASILTGNLTLAALAGGIGINWASEAVASLWRAKAPDSSSPLATAFFRALRRSVDALRKEYVSTFGSKRSLTAFDLLRECANDVSQALYPASYRINLDSAHRGVEKHLENLLLDHEGADWIKPRLLETVTLEFQRELSSDPEALRVFQDWRVQQTLANQEEMQAELGHLPEVLEGMRDMRVLLDQISQLVRSREISPETSAPVAQIVFDNRGLTARDIEQVGGNKYVGSAHAEGPGSRAIVINRDPTGGK